MNKVLGYFNKINKRVPFSVHYFNPDMMEPQWKEKISISNSFFLCLPQYRRLWLQYHCLDLCYYQCQLYATLIEMSTCLFGLSIHCAVGQWAIRPNVCDLSSFNTLHLHCPPFLCLNLPFILWLYLFSCLVSLFCAYVSMKINIGLMIT